MTGVCGVLGAVFHGRADGTRPSRFLDDGEEGDDDEESYRHPQGMDLRPMEVATATGPPLPTLVEEASTDNGDHSVISDAQESCGTSVTS